LRFKSIANPIENSQQGKISIAKDFLFCFYDYAKNRDNLPLIGAFKQKNAIRQQSRTKNKANQLKAF
jgi:hypothetical protein